MKKKKLSDKELFDRYEDISLSVRKLVDRMTADLTKADDFDVRESLTEMFRFWSGKK